MRTAHDAKNRIEPTDHLEPLRQLSALVDEWEVESRQDDEGAWNGRRYREWVACGHVFQATQVGREKASTSDGGYQKNMTQKAACMYGRRRDKKTGRDSNKIDEAEHLQDGEFSGPQRQGRE